MKAIYHGFVLMLTVTHLLALYPADRDIRACTCSLHGSECSCCIASVSDSIQAPQIPLKCDCDIEMPQIKEGAMLSGVCRCKEVKKDYESPSMAVVIQPEMIVRFNEGSKIFCRKEGLILPGYKTPPMKPPPIV
jgi:hypothetical protein